MRRVSIWQRSLLGLGLVVALGACNQQAAEPTADTGGETASSTAMATEASVEGPCTDTIGCVEVATGDPVRLGALLVLSGPNESLGVDSREGAEIAIDDFGDVKGHPVELVAEDAGCSAEGGQTAASKVAADESIVAVVGTSCSSEAQAAIPILTEAGITMVSSSNTAPGLTAADRPANYAGYLRTAHNDKFQGRVAAEFAYNELGVKTAATIHDGSPYAQQLQEVFAEVFTGLGGTITGQEAVNVGDTDMKPVLTTIAAGSPELIYYPIFVAEGGFVTDQARDVAGLEKTILMGADGMFSPDFVTAAGSAAAGMYLTGPYVQGAEYDAFLKKFDAKFGGVPPSGYHAHAYDAATMLLTAIDTTSTEGPDGTLYIPRQGVRDAMYAMAGYKGLTGTLTCNGPGSDNPGDCATGEALAVFEISPEVAADPAANWPPAVKWQPGQ